MPKISKKLNIALRQKANYSKEVKPLKKFNTPKVATQNPLAINQTPVASARHQTHSDFITKPRREISYSALF